MCYVTGVVAQISCSRLPHGSFRLIKEETQWVCATVIHKILYEVCVYERVGGCLGASQSDCYSSAAVWTRWRRVQETTDHRSTLGIKDLHDAGEADQ